MGFHVQDLLRHSRAATTTDIYMQEIPESVQATVDSINQELRKKSAAKNGEKGGLREICYPAGRSDVCKYMKIWWTWSGSNRRRLPCHFSILT